MPDLLDTNVWLALAHPGHPFHRRALFYWRREAALELAFTWVTALGFLRLLTNEKVMGGRPLASAEAWKLFKRFLERPGVSVHQEPGRLMEHLEFFSERFSLRGGYWTDAYLAAFAISGGYRLVTFDRDFERFPGLHLLLLRA